METILQRAISSVTSFLLIKFNVKWPFEKEKLASRCEYCIFIDTEKYSLITSKDNSKEWIILVLSDSTSLLFCFNFSLVKICYILSNYCNFMIFTSQSMGRNVQWCMSSHPLNFNKKKQRFGISKATRNIYGFLLT